MNIWKTKPLKDIHYNRNFKGTEAEEEYARDSRTGLWIKKVSRESCEASDGFVCNVRFDSTEYLVFMVKNVFDSEKRVI